MKLSDYARQMGVRYETAWRWFRDGKIQGRRVGPHTIIITEGQEEPQTATPPRIAIYRYFVKDADTGIKGARW